LNDLFVGTGKPPPPPRKPPRLVHIEPKGTEKTHPSSGGMRHMTASCTFSLTDTAHEDRFKSLLKGGRLPVRLTAAYQFDEDGRVGSSDDSHAKLSLINKLPSSFTVRNATNGSLIIDGPVGDDEELLEIKSDPYDSDYTGRIKFTYGPIPGKAPESGDSDG